MSFDLEYWAAPRRELVYGRLMGLFADAWPDPFVGMLRYPLEGAGKYVRPLLTLAAYEAVAATPLDPEPALAPALAVELVHTYSLVHDDLPCMDDDTERRGRATTHVRYTEGAAVLIGDALLTEAFRLLAQPSSLPAAARLDILGELATAAGYHGMIGGQAADVGFGGPVTDLEALTRLHRGKTGALIRAAVRMGALAGGADSEALAALTRYAEALGLAFQLADDLLDLDQDAGEEGPPAFPKLLGAEETARRARALAADALAAVATFPRRGPLEALATFTVERDT